MSPEHTLEANVSRCRTHDSRTTGLTCLLGDMTVRGVADVQPLQGRPYPMLRGAFSAGDIQHALFGQAEFLEHLPEHSKSSGKPNRSVAKQGFKVSQIC